MASLLSRKSIVEICTLVPCEWRSTAEPASFYATGRRLKNISPAITSVWLSVNAVLPTRWTSSLRPESHYSSGRPRQNGPSREFSRYIDFLLNMPPPPPPPCRFPFRADPRTVFRSMLTRRKRAWHGGTPLIISEVHFTFLDRMFLHAWSVEHSEMLEPLSWGGTSILSAELSAIEQSAARH